MKTLSLSTHWHRTSALARGLALSALAASAWALSVAWSPAQARDVYWSVGIQQPGMVLGVSNAQPVVVVPQYVPPPKHRPVVQQPPVVVQQPPVVVYGPPVWVHAPHRSVQPVVLLPQPVYVQNWGHGPRWDERRERRHHRRHDRHERYERSDRNDRGGYGADHRHGPDRR
jgi:hypothetical protein